MAAKLAEMGKGINSYVREPMEIKADMRYKRVHSPKELLEHYLLAAGKKLRRLPPPVDAFRGIVARRIVSVSSKISLIKILLSNKRLRLIELYKGAKPAPTLWQPSLPFSSSQGRAAFT